MSQSECKNTKCTILVSNQLFTNHKLNYKYYGWCDTCKYNHTAVLKKKSNQKKRWERKNSENELKRIKKAFASDKVATSFMDSINQFSEDANTKLDNVIQRLKSAEQNLDQIKKLAAPNMPNSLTIKQARQIHLLHNLYIKDSLYQVNSKSIGKGLFCAVDIVSADINNCLVEFMGTRDEMNEKKAINSKNKYLLKLNK